MKRQWKRIWTLMLALALMIGAVSPAVRATDTTAYVPGDLVEFGSYPQTRVTDETLLAALNAAAPQTWTTFSYCSGMQYCDVLYGGERYRGVIITSYRPHNGVNGYYPLDSTYQDDNGYQTNTRYWFRWDPIVWRVLDPDTGLVLSQSLIDSQPFQTGFYTYSYVNWGDPEKTYYANNYAHSTIRQWLTGEFCDAAFTSAQQLLLSDATPAGEDTVFLLSAEEAKNESYGFQADGHAYDPVRQPTASAYARCQGLHPAYESPCYNWWLRTPGDASGSASRVDERGWIIGYYYYYCTVKCTDYGVRPAVRMDLRAAGAHTHDYTPAVTAPTCTIGGHTVYTCLCGDSYTGDFQWMLGHSSAQPDSVTSPTCTGSGYTAYTCERCGQPYTKDVLEPLGHDYGEWIVTQAAADGEMGTQTRSCSRCPASETRALSGVVPGYGFFSGGFGTEEAPFQIASAADFDHIDDFFASYGDALPANPVHFTQTANIVFYYNSEDDNDGTGYSMYDPDGQGEYFCAARPTPVREMHCAVYDGCGYKIALSGWDTLLLDSDYIGLFGVVSDSVIGNLKVDWGCINGMIATGASPSAGGVIGRAVNCRLENISVTVCEMLPFPPEAMLVGSAAGCIALRCFTNCGFMPASFIGGADSDYRFVDCWSESYCTPEAGFLRGITGVILLDGMAAYSAPPDQLLADGCGGNYLLADQQRVVYPTPLQYDPSTAGLLYYACCPKMVTVTAGAHGTVIGTGEYQMFQRICDQALDDPNTIADLTPIPDAGYVFTGWDLSDSDAGSMLAQPDGSYTFQSNFWGGDVIVTATFAPHAPHRFDTRIVTEPTCLAGGCTTYLCTECGYSYTAEPTDALGHSFGEWIITTPATVTAQGVETRICSVCRETETRAIPCLPHTPAILTISAPDNPVYTGDTVSLTVDLSQNPGLIGMALTLTYDPAVLTLTGVETNGMFRTGSLTCSKELHNLPYTVLWDDSTAPADHTETGTILTLTFAVQKTAAAGVTTVSLTCGQNAAFDWNLQPVPMLMTGADLTARVHTPGDADGDGEFDLADVAAIVRYLAGGWDVTIDVRNADMDGDGKMTLKDPVLGRRFLAGWDVTLQ